MSTGNEQSPGLIGRMAGAVTGRVVEVVDPNILLDQVDIDRLMARMDPDDLLDRIDVNALLDRIDVNRLLDRVDVDALLSRADVEAVVRRSGVPDLITSSTTQIAGSLVDVVRRQLVGLDTILDRGLNQVLRRAPDPARATPPTLRPAAVEAPSASGRLGVTGRYAGVLGRSLAAVADVAIISSVFTLGVAGLRVLADSFLDTDLSGAASGAWGIAAWAVWVFLYSWVSLTIAGRTPGKALIGNRVVAASGAPIGPGQALVRTLALPFSLLLGGIGLLIAIPHPQHRALHDLIARTAVVNDWGDRPAELPGPLSAYVARHAEQAAVEQ